MKREIGSEFWITKIPNKYIEGSPDWINVWGANVLTSSGRAAISLMLRQVEDEVISKTVLLPAYTCESVIIPFIKEGYTCYFYDVDKELKPNKENINTFLEKSIGIFLHIGYFGFSTNNNLHDYINQLKTKGTIIVEDITHTLYSKYKRYTGNDYYIASLIKWMGLPSGGLLASKKNSIETSLDFQKDFSKKRKEALLLKGQYIESNNEELKNTYLTMFGEAKNILDNDLNPYGIDEDSKLIINELDIDELIKKRRENYIFLLKAFKGIGGIEPVFNKIPHDICPLFFPIYIHKEREKLRKKLINKRIYCPIHWTIPSQIDISNYPLSQNVYSNILSIPCDQRYDTEDMTRIIDTINDAKKCNTKG